jgi:threonine aldolase
MNHDVQERNDLFGEVDFFFDGLALKPAEYVELLNRRLLNSQISVDHYSIGGVIEQLEERFAQLLGKERAIYFQTGTLANHIALRKLAGSKRRVLVQAESHLYNDTGDCAGTLSGLTLIPLAPNQASFTLDTVKEWVDRTKSGLVPGKIGAISIENPVRRQNHSMFDFDELVRISDYARQQGIGCHLDGARMFTLPLHSGKTVDEIASLFDTVYVSLKKHFNATAGAILAGDSRVIEGMHHLRKMFGGSPPQSWVQVALVDTFVDSFEAEYAGAWAAAEAFLRKISGGGQFEVKKIANGTSRFLLKPLGVDPDRFRALLLKNRISLPMVDTGSGTFRMQVNPTLKRMTPDKLAEQFINAFLEATG